MMNADIRLPFLRRVADDGADRRHVVVLDRPAERVGHQALGEAQKNRVRVLQQRRTQIRRTVDGRAVVHHARSDRRHAAVLDAPLARRIEVLEREAERIDHPVARVARRVGAMLLHPLAHRQQPRVLDALGLLEVRARSAAAVAAACPAALPSPTCRAAPATCDRRPT